MLARRLLCRRQLWQASCCQAAVRCTQSAASQLPEMSNFETRLPEVKKKEPQRQPFVKNLFLGVFDHEFVYYPEPQTKKRHQHFFEWLKPVESYMAECSANPAGIRRDEVIAHLRDLDVFRAQVSVAHLGLGLTHTELTKLLEVLSILPWMGSYFVKNYMMPIQLIDALASDAQKANYMPRIASGEIVPTVCFTEAVGFNTQNLKTRATLSGDSWLLNGEKRFVANGRDANLYLVFAQSGVGMVRDSSNKDLSVFLVENNSEGITLRDDDTLVGQQGSSVNTVSFNDVKVPRENLIGEVGCALDVLIESMAPGNRHTAPQAIGILRMFMKVLVTHVLQRKHIDRNLYEFEAVQEVVGKIATRLYGMESVLYMTTGMIDSFDKQDCMIEKAMAEAYCANECAACVYEGLQIIGAQSYLREKPYIKFLEDALSYTLYDSYNVDSNIYISLLGLQHTGKHMFKHVHKLRNPLTYPKFLISWVFGKEFKLRLHIAEHMHPSLQRSADTLDDCITKLAHASIALLERHGLSISEQQMELRKLSELATTTFTLVAVLSRVSRSYCIGLRNAEQDRHVANSFASLSLDRVAVLANEIMSEGWQTNDRLYKNVAELMYSKKEYFAEHPLNRSY